MDREKLERRIAALPICGYGFLPVSDLPFKEEVRYICRTECPRYGKSWSCPPAVGSLEECRKRCLCYEGGFVFTTMAEVTDPENMEEMLSTRKEHEEISRKVRDLFLEEEQKVLVLSTESCAICAHCTYPEGPCRHPDNMFESLEGYGILVTELAERCGIPFLAENHLITWFSLVLYKPL